MKPSPAVGMVPNHYMIKLKSVSMDIRRYLFSIFYLSFISNACNISSQQIETVPLEDFENDTTVIASGTKVALLAVSGSRMNNEDEIYYSQVLVVNEHNDDTLIVLCPAMEMPPADENSPAQVILPIQFDPGKGISEAVYKRVSNDLNIFLQLGAEAMAKSGNPASLSRNLSKYQGGQIIRQQKVLVNRSMPVFSNKYKTVVGILVFSTDVKKKSS